MLTKEDVLSIFHGSTHKPNTPAEASAAHEKAFGNDIRLVCNNLTNEFNNAKERGTEGLLCLHPTYQNLGGYWYPPLTQPLLHSATSAFKALLESQGWTVEHIEYHKPMFYSFNYSVVYLNCYPTK